MKKVMLIIRDGWGYSTRSAGNAIMNADTPFDDWLQTQATSVLLACHGEKVGLPPGFQGSSEVGHLNMGAGRIVEQEVTRIFNDIRSHAFFDSACFDSIRSLLNSGGIHLHFTGLLQDEGVHAHQEHLFELYRAIRSEFPNVFIWFHPIADGRDTPPRSFVTFYDSLIHTIGADSQAGIGTVWGRYYGMDRSRIWSLISVAMNALLHAKGKKVDDIRAAVIEAYEAEVTPDNAPMGDEYLKPLISSTYSGMKPGDVVINFNYRQDRAIQISQAFVDPACPAYQDICGRLHYYGLTRYYNEFEHFLMPPMDDSGSLNNILGDVLSQNRKRQLRLAETQKFRHVTSFFNGKSTHPFPLEEQVEIPGKWDPSSFASHPEMNAADVTEELLSRRAQAYDFIAVNYANCDMVGHTGDYDAAVKAVECVDAQVAVVAKKAMKDGYVVIVTADHGNSEEMTDEKGRVKTAHTTNPVKMHMIHTLSGVQYAFTTKTGILSDIAPLILKLMNLPIPDEMTSRHLADSLEILETS